MTYQHYSPEFKARIVLQVLQGEKELGEVAKEHNIKKHPGTVLCADGTKK